MELCLELGFCDLPLSAGGIQRMQRKYMEKLCSFLCPSVSLVHSSQVKSSISSQTLFISEAVIFITKKGKKVNVKR